MERLITNIANNGELKISFSKKDKDSEGRYYVNAEVEFGKTLVNLNDSGADLKQVLIDVDKCVDMLKHIECVHLGLTGCQDAVYALEQK